MIKALRRASMSPGEAIFFPYEGTIFNSREEARDFYNLYSWEKGFGVRFGRGKKNDSKYQTKLDIVCSCEVNMKLVFNLAPILTEKNVICGKYIH